MPLMVRTFRTLPPTFLMGSGNNPVRGNRAVFGGVPLGGNVWMEGSKGVGNRELSPATTRASRSLAGAAFDPGFPLMVPTPGALPPIFLIRSGNNLVRGNSAVFGGVPLGGNVRMKGSKGDGNREL